MSWLGTLERCPQPLPARLSGRRAKEPGRPCPRWFLAVRPARPERFELPTFGSVDRRSIQLSYGREVAKCSRADPRARRDHGGAGTHAEPAPAVAKADGDGGNGEGGIRTRDRGFPPYSLSRRVPSATRPPLRRARGILEQGRAAHAAAADRSRANGPSYHRAGPRRGGRVVECTGLENRRARKGSAGSNPAPSVTVTAPTASFRTSQNPYIAGANLHASCASRGTD
jgi:hypothetical protein